MFEGKQIFFTINTAFNLKLRELTNSEDRHFLLPSPSLDNNAWSSLRYLEQGVLGIIKDLAEERKPTWQSETPQSWKRSTVGILVELAVAMSRKTFSVSHCGAVDSLRGKVALFTYADFEEPNWQETRLSRYWSNLAKENHRECCLVGVGESNLQRTGLKFGGCLISRARAIRDFLSTYGARLRLWRKIKSNFEGDRFFASHRAEFARGIFGAPGFEAAVMAKNFGKFLDEFKPKSIFLPHENQLWERVLCKECDDRSIKVYGAIHTTPRIWDLRFFQMHGFESFQPTNFIDNGPLAREMLQSGGIDEGRILSGSALRFEHLRDRKFESTHHSSSQNRGRALLITGADLSSALNLSNLAKQSPEFSSKDWSHRPHPANLSVFAKKSGFPETDLRPFQEIIDDYEVFVSEAIGSLAFELAFLGKVVLIYLPDNQLNFSPMATLPEFKNYFANVSELDVLLANLPGSVALRSVLNLERKTELWAGALRKATNV